MSTTMTETSALTDVAGGGDGATQAVKAAESTAAGISSPTMIDDAGELAQNLYQPTTLGEDQASTMQGLVDKRQVVRNGQIVYGEKPKPIKAFNSSTSSSTDVFGPDGKAIAMPEGVAGKILAFARGALGIPYVWGGESRSGYDCSGLVQAAFAAAGIKMPRLSYDQMNKGQRISLNNLRPGDLVGYDYSNRFPGAEHIAIYIGGGRIIEAPRPGRSVQIGHVHDTPGAFAVRIIK